ncbi:MAG: mechanosensitive ion channel family protein [bacterium]|nr:mechanosensitive ion channel family protein [bacterium]
MKEILDNLLPAVRDNVWLQAATIIVLAVIAAKVVDFLITRIIAVWAKKSETDLDDRLIAILHRPIFLSVVLVGIWLATVRLPIADSYFEFILRILKTIGVLMWAVFATRAVAILLEAVSRLEGRAAFIESRTVALFDNVAKVILIGGAVYFLLLSWGIDVGGWMVSAGVLGLVLGLAAKDTLSNLFSGLFILADAPYEEGDFVNLDSGERGQVTKIGLRSTRLLTRDDIEITVPNSVIANAKIINETGGPWEKERVRVRVGAGYGCDVAHVRSVLDRIAAENQYVAEHPEPRVRLRALGDSALEFELLCWIDEPVLRGRTLDALYETVYNRFREEGIEIPFPKRDVYLHNSAPTAE